MAKIGKQFPLDVASALRLYVLDDVLQKAGYTLTTTRYHASFPKNTIREAMRSSKMTSAIQKRSVVLNGHKTSVSLEEAFWTGLKEIASSKQMTLADLVSAIDRDRKTGNLSSALRLYVLEYYRSTQQSREDPAADKASVASSKA